MKSNLGFDRALSRKPDEVLDSHGTHGEVRLWETPARVRRSRQDSFRQEAPVEQPHFTAASLALLGLVKRRLWLILSITLLVTVLTGWGVFALKNQYTATTLLMLDPRSTRLLEPEAASALAADGEVEILRSDSVALQVVKRLGLDNEPEFVPEPGYLSKLVAPVKDYILGHLEGVTSEGGAVQEGTLQETDAASEASAIALRMLKAKVAIRRRGLTDVIAIDVTSEDPRHAARVANAYADAYLEEQVSAKLKGLERAEAALTRRLSELDEELKRSEVKIGLRQVYQDNLLRLKTISQQRDTIGPDARIASPALPPDVPSFPRRKLLLMLGAMAGLGLAMGAAYLRDVSARRIQTAEELEPITGAPNLASIPNTRNLKASERRYPQDEVTMRPMSAYSESVRRLFFTLRLMMNRGSKLGVVLVTSTGPQEGKSTLALSLARSAAIAGSSVVVVDCNLREPGLHKLVGLQNDVGLVDLLSNSAGECSVLQSDPKSSCKLVTSGNVEKISPEWLYKAKSLKDALRKLETEFDLVILDAPATGVYADSLVLMHGVDAVLFAVRAGMANPSEIRSTLQQLRRTNDADLFTVLTFSPARGAHANAHS